MLSPSTSSSKSRNLKGKYMSSYQKSFRQVPLLTGGGGGGGGYQAKISSLFQYFFIYLFNLFLSTNKTLSLNIYKS